MMYRVTKMYDDGTVKTETINGHPEFKRLMQQLDKFEILSFVIVRNKQN